ncbi:MAG: T9SS type A sorting domain-containing protein [Vicingaceae bacterium]|nr:T9SS type A sorting domain-containing protein [Vicingaceae bacterium]
MKKKLLSLITLLGAGVIANAQITINDTHIVGIGDAVEQSIDTLATSVSNIGPSGANQTWNFTGMTEHVVDTLFFENQASYPGSSSFPNANIGMRNSVQDSAWSFLNKSTSGLFIVGQSGFQQAQLVTLNFAGTIVTFPSTMGTSYSGTWSGTLFQQFIGQQGIDSVRMTRGASSSSVVDAWGNVTTPFGTFASIRQNITDINIDTIWLYQFGTWNVIDPFTATLFGVDPITHDTVNIARWWTDDPISKFPVIELEYNNNGDVYRVSWQKSSPFVGVEEMNAKPMFSLYPNPAKDVINISTDKIENSIISIFDIAGKEVKSIDFNTSNTSLNISDLDAGVYFYAVRNRLSGKVTHTTKFIVTK